MTIRVLASQDEKKLITQVGSINQSGTSGTQQNTLNPFSIGITALFSRQERGQSNSIQPITSLTPHISSSNSIAMPETETEQSAAEDS